VPKTLIVGRDYGPIFGIFKGTMVYNGGISWTATQVGRESMTRDSQKTTDNAIAYINQDTYSVGIIR
jgi:hypothetical protein